MKNNTSQKDTRIRTATQHTRNTNKRFRVCTFTLNNFSPDEVNKILAKKSELGKLIFQSEIGENNGTPHLQGMAQHTSAKTLQSWKTFFDINRLHIEQCRNINASENYCTKKETWSGVIRFVWKNDKILINIIYPELEDSKALIVRPEPKTIIDYKNQQMYEEGDNTSRMNRKKRFINFINREFMKFVFEEMEKNLEEY